ncbi:MAG: orotidine 5'-phosphate decarboxylase [Thermoplasmata archaeon]|nr:orotidine 5'-phosphate decarboxylase [Thermoplasmata archaeon]
MVERTFPVLQVALDLIQLDRAVQIAREAIEGGADWLEAGTPLIKSEGMDAVRRLRSEFPGAYIVADMKTADLGAAEVEMAARAGANAVAMLGAADGSTVEEALKTAARFGVDLQVDLLGIADVEGRVGALEPLGVRRFCYHVGVDQQMRAQRPFEGLEALRRITGAELAVAGGLNSETAAEAVASGADIVIVGGAIIKSRDVAAATSDVASAMRSGKAVPSEHYRRYDGAAIVEAFTKVSTPNVADAMQKAGGMVGILPHIRPGRKMAGPAVTVRTIDGDWAKPIEAIDVASPGEVIVIDAGGGTTAIWGELASWSCLEKGIAGVVIDGAARDIPDVIEMDFPLFSRHLNPVAGDPKGHGEIGSTITCGGVKVRPGDWIVGDGTGVIVVPREAAVEMANRSLDVLERENRIREEIQRGSTLSRVLELERWEVRR